MSLHARVVSRAVGATGELVDRVAEELAATGDVKPDRAREVLARLARVAGAPAAIAVSPATLGKEAP
jgi:hydroxymethylglutaryl-CoA reductase